MILRHARMQVDEKGEIRGIREMRKHMSWYTTGLPDSARLRGMGERSVPTMIWKSCWKNPVKEPKKAGIMRYPGT